MIVDIHAAPLLSTPLTSANDVWTATQEHPALFSRAAERVGMSPREYQEFRSTLLAGKAVYVRLPGRVDAISAVRQGAVYALHDAVLPKTQMGWRVALADGNTVYVPQASAAMSFTLKRAAPKANIAKISAKGFAAYLYRPDATLAHQPPVTRTHGIEAAFEDVAPTPEDAVVVADAVQSTLSLPSAASPADTTSWAPSPPTWTPPEPPSWVPPAPPSCSNGSNLVGVCWH